MNVPTVRDMVGDMKYGFTGSLLLLFSSLSLAETAYVSDHLRVGVRPEPENTAPVGVVTSGMKLEILDRDGAYIKIRSESGQQGWIKDIYVVSEPPAIIQLKQVKAQSEKMQLQLKTLEENNNVLQQANQSLSEKVEELETQRNRYQLEKAKQQSNRLSGSEKTSQGWLWWILAIIVLAGIGFVSGINWHRQQIMKRLGGLRV